MHLHSDWYDADIFSLDEDDGLKRCRCPKPCVEEIFEETVSTGAYFSEYADVAYQQFAALLDNDSAAAVEESRQQL